MTYVDAVVSNASPTALADGGRVLENGAGGHENVDVDLTSVTRQHVGYDFVPCLAWLLQHHRPTYTKHGFFANISCKM